MANVRGSLYAKLIGGQNLNVADLLLDNFGNMNKAVERIIVECDSSNGAPIGITLPQISALGPATNFELLVSDKAGSAATANITITRGGSSDKINGTTTSVINTNYGKCHILVGSVGTGAGWVAFNLSQSQLPSQANEQGVIDGAGDFTLANTPLTTQHIIVCNAGRVLTVGTDYTVNALTKKIHFLLLAPGDPVNVFYSF
jgi:hypothetical protein